MGCPVTFYTFIDLLYVNNNINSNRIKIIIIEDSKS